MPRLLLSVLLLLSIVPSARAQEAVRAAAVEEMEQRFPRDHGRMSVRVLRTGGDAEEMTQPRVLLPARDGLPTGRTQVRVEDDQGRTGWAMIYVAHYDSVVVARTDVDRGAEVPPSALSVAWMETTSFHGEPLRAPAFRHLQADGTLYADRPLRAGRALRHDDLRRPYAAETGAPVEMWYRRGRLTFRLSCKAREPGFAGDVVRLYSDDTDTMYRARLVDSGRATWVETL